MTVAELSTRMSARELVTWQAYLAGAPGGAALPAPDQQLLDDLLAAYPES